MTFWVALKNKLLHFSGGTYGCAFGNENKGSLGWWEAVPGDSRREGRTSLCWLASSSMLKERASEGVTSSGRERVPQLGTNICLFLTWDTVRGQAEDKIKQLTT